jgi:hypothetical protein
MSDPTKNPFDLLLEQIRLVVREEIRAAVTYGLEHSTEKDNLLTVEQAAQIMGGADTPEGLRKRVCWLYRHAKGLPFTRRLSRKCTRFSESGLRRWVATRKP